ncbi:hypothetical protein YPPY54_0850, partial [Yersinia pestis PY-54]
MEIMTIS